MQNDREIFEDLTDSGVFLSFTTNFFLENGYSRKNCTYKPVLNIEADVTYYCACKSSQKERFKNLFADLQSVNSLHNKINFSF